MRDFYKLRCTVFSKFENYSASLFSRFENFKRRIPFQFKNTESMTHDLWAAPVRSFLGACSPRKPHSVECRWLGGRKKLNGVSSSVLISFKKASPNYWSRNTNFCYFSSYEFWNESAAKFENAEVWKKLRNCAMDTFKICASLSTRM